MTIRVPTPNIRVPTVHRKGGKVYLQYTLTSVSTASIQSGGRAGIAPQENVSLTYESIQWTYTKQKPEGEKK